MCYNKLGMRNEVITAYREMKEDYPLSQWTREISKAGMIPEDIPEEPQEKETVSPSEEKEEELKIIPIDP